MRIPMMGGMRTVLRSSSRNAGFWRSHSLQEEVILNSGWNPVLLFIPGRHSDTNRWSRRSMTATINPVRF